MIRGLIDIYEHEGWLPDCHMSFSKGYTQVIMAKIVKFQFTKISHRAVQMPMLFLLMPTSKA